VSDSAIANGSPHRISADRSRHAARRGWLSCFGEPLKSLAAFDISPSSLLDFSEQITNDPTGPPLRETDGHMRKALLLFSLLVVLAVPALASPRDDDPRGGRGDIIARLVRVVHAFEDFIASLPKPQPRLKVTASFAPDL
jgi:hypothetical protein